MISLVERRMVGSVEVVGDRLDLDDMRCLRMLGGDFGSVGNTEILLFQLYGFL